MKNEIAVEKAILKGLKLGLECRVCGKNSKERLLAYCTDDNGKILPETITCYVFCYSDGAGSLGGYEKASSFIKWSGISDEWGLSANKNAWVVFKGRKLSTENTKSGAFIDKSIKKEKRGPTP